MTQPQPPESTNNHRPQPESPSFVKRGKLWVPETAERRSLLQRFWYWTGFKEKKLWDVLQLLIVPTALALGAFYLQETAKQRDLQIADDRAKQETLNRYFDQISMLLFEKRLRTSKDGSEARIMAQTRTFSALQDLNGKRRGDVIRFLYQSKLIQTNQPIIDLSHANLDGAVLPMSNLQNANFDRAMADNAKFSLSNLTGATFRDSSLQHSTFFVSNLSKANLEKAGLSGATILGSDLTDTNLSNADLSEYEGKRTMLINVDLRGANLRGANLFRAQFSDVKVDSDTFNQALLCETFLPDETISNRDCDKIRNFNPLTVPK